MDLMIRFDAYPPRFFGGQESLRIYNDGTIFYHSTAAGESFRQNRAGTFTHKLNSDERLEAQQLVATIFSLSEKVVAQRGAFQFEVTAFQEGKPKTYPLFSDDPLPESLIFAQERFAQWQDKAESSPLAVVTLNGQLNRGTTHDNLVFTFKNTGLEPVLFLMDSNSFELRLSKLGSEARLWSVPERPRVGLMSEKGALIDGLTIPAKIDPGSHASLVFQIPPDSLNPGQVGVAHMTGTILLLEPGEPAAPFPETPFALTSEVNQGS